MNSEIQTVIEKFKEVREILKKFDNRDEAIEYLVNETKLSFNILHFLLSSS